MSDHQSEYHFPSVLNSYHGKVRDVYFLQGDRVVIVASNRISAFDHILSREIPYKGQVLNLMAAHFLNATRDIVPNWLEATPHPNVSVGKACTPIKLEMVVRGYLAGHAWRTYRSGQRTLCGVEMPDGMVESQRFESPIITPATKAEEGHDEDISREEILQRGIVDEALYSEMESYALALFERGTVMAEEKDLLLVDTKYEFGLYRGQLMLIDEVHTADSSRYYIADEYRERLDRGKPQQQLSKEFVREWLMDNGFQGKEGQEMPVMPDEFVEEVSERYIDLYERLTGVSFKKMDGEMYGPEAISNIVTEYLDSHKPTDLD